VFKQNRKDGFDDFTGPYVYHNKGGKIINGETIPESFKIMGLNYRSPANTGCETLGEYGTLKRATDVLLNMALIHVQQKGMEIYYMPKE